MIKLKISKKSVAIILIASLLGRNVSAEESFEFDNSLLDSYGFNGVDLSAFAGANGSNGNIASGQYMVQMYVNDELVSREQIVTFYTTEEGSNVCMTTELAMQIPLRYSYIKELQGLNDSVNKDGDECLNLKYLDEAVKVEFNSSTQTVDISIPQAFIEDRDINWLPPEFRDYGIPGIMLDYSLLWNASRYETGDNGKHTESFIRSYGTAGLNIGRIRFRADYQYSSESDQSFDWTQVYAYTDIPVLNAKLQVGEISALSNVFNTVRMKGASLYSDENMMPNYLLGYSPQVTGAATTQSVVTISQYGNVIKRVQVPAGPFAISDLPSYLTGTISVEIEGIDGDIQNYQMDIARVPYMTRKGRFRFNLNAGKVDLLYNSKNMKIDPKLIMGDFSYGISNNISFMGGVQHTTNSEFKSFNVGLGFNLEQFGALSFDVTQARTSLEGKETLKGESYRFNYAKRFSSELNLTLAAYRFSSRDFTNLNNYLNLKGSISDNVYYSSFGQYEKNRFSLSLSQFFTGIGLNVAGTITKGTYWNEANMTSYNLSLSKHIKKEGYFQGTSISVNLSQNKRDGDDYKQIGIYVSIPLNVGGSLHYSSNYNQQSKRINQSVSYSNSAAFGSYNLGTYFNHKRDLSGSIDYNLTGSLSTRTRYGTIDVSADYNNYGESMMVGFDNSLTLTKYGLATHDRVYQAEGSRVILDAGAPGVMVDDGSMNQSNAFGLIGVSNVGVYQKSTQRIDNNNLPEDVEISRSIVDSRLVSGSIGYHNLGGISGEKAISTITLSDGSYPPFGAVVYRENGVDREVAIVAENGLTYLTGLQRNSTFTIKWGDASCELKIKSLNVNDLQDLTCHTNME